MEFWSNGIEAQHSNIPLLQFFTLANPTFVIPACF
jgi:hypothetical protein